MSTTLIRDALIINEGQRMHQDVLIRAGRIARVGDNLSAPADGEIVEAHGRALIPGMIDDQVHFREPGLEHKGNIATESKAAVAGGITSYMEMPNTQPPATSSEQIMAKKQRARGRSAANYSFYLGATNDNIDDIRALDPNLAAGIKIFMGASTGNMLVDNVTTLEHIFRDAPCIITTHCEDTPMIRERMRQAQERYGRDIPASAHPWIRSAEACLKSSTLAVELARTHGSQLHVLHLTTATELDLFTPGAIDNKAITAEACVHHLYYCDEDYPRLGHQIKCNPAIKSASDRAALIQGLVEGRLDIIATDHAPHTRAEKFNDDYTQAAAGLPLVQFALPMALELMHDGHLSLEQIVEKTSHNIARRFQIAERGFIREGYWADLALLDLEGRFPVREDEVLYHCGWSPLSGDTLRSRIASTWVNGRLVWNGRKVLHDAAGQAMVFMR